MPYKFFSFLYRTRYDHAVVPPSFGSVCTTRAPHPANGTLNISTKTLDIHRGNVKKKLGLTAAPGLGMMVAALLLWVDDPGELGGKAKKKGRKLANVDEPRQLEG